MNAALETDPDNADLKSLKESLQSLIELFNTVAPKSSSSLPPSKRSGGGGDGDGDDDSVKRKKIGDRVLARYSGDKSWSEAKVLGVSSNQQRTTYSVEFIRRNLTAVVDAKDIKDVPSNYKPPSQYKRTASQAASGATTAANSSGTAAGADGEPVKKKQRREDRFESQTAWQKFTKKTAAGKKRSMFATPDEVSGRVGVTGSGRGVTKFAEKTRYETVGKLEGLETAAKGATNTSSTAGNAGSGSSHAHKFSRGR